MRPELLGNQEHKQDIQVALNGYFSGNSTTAQTRGIEWEALKVVIRGESITKSYGIRRKLELAQQEDVLAVLQRQIDNGDASEAECRMVHGRIRALWSRLDNYVHGDFRQRLYQGGARSGRMLAWLL
ncbi:hypothetical protein NDU88_004366 [Pleurodeles waltl]|uniref:Uncharacterized protein n=1 Tax=Pleurodeles waltl TaxID=8319 RepID=A0AAV7V4H5_PLEWA|nr:hypothetical protein NDU88_004366 [Pleurodeles waltl]